MDYSKLLHSHTQHTATETKYVSPGSVPSTPLFKKMERSSYLPGRQSIQVYCPPCQQNYFMHEVEHHALIHDQPLQHNHSSMQPVALAGSEKHEPLQQYPLLEGIQFNCADFSKPKPKQDKFQYRFIDTTRVKHVKEYGTQTIDRPPLQIPHPEPNLFNFLDPIANDQQFSPKYIINNKGIESRRHLNQWEQKRRNKNY